MPPSYHFGDSTPVYESTCFPYTSYQHYAQPDQTWILTDPALTQFQHEYDLQQKHNQNAQQEVFAFQNSVANSEYLPGFQHVIDISGSSIHHNSWSFPLDSYRDTRYKSPNGQYGGTLSASSSEYGLSPENRTSSMLINKCSQPFAFVPTPIESCLSQQDMWHNDNDFMGSLPSPPDSTIANTQAIALRELEFSCGPDYYQGQYLPQEEIIGFGTGVPIHIPEELELTESIATLTTSSRTDTLLTPNSIGEGTDQEELDHDSDPDFTPRRPNSGRRSSQSTARILVQPWSPRRNASIQSHPVQDSKSRVQKSTRRSALYGNKERRKSRTHTRPALTKSYSTGAISKGPKDFPCTFHVFGCQATFGNKNEWKRHVSSQHLQLGFFRCDLGECNPDNVFRYNPGNEGRHRRKGSNIKQDLEEDEIEVTYNDFNRKDLFTQHCRRMHGPHRYTTDSTSVTNQMICERIRRMTNNGLTSKQKTMKLVVTKEDEAAFELELEDIRQRCWQVRRKAPARSCCGFCNQVFQVEEHLSFSSSKSRSNGNSSTEEADEDEDDDGKAEEKAWEERMEHIGKHYERDNVRAQLEPVDEDLEEWGISVGILERRVGAKGNSKSWLLGCVIPTSRSQDGKAIKKEEEGGEEEEEEEEDNTENSPRRSGLRSRVIRPKNGGLSLIKSEADEKHVKDENSDDDASGEDE